MVWVVPTPSAKIDIDGHLNEMATDLAPFGLENYSHYETRVLQTRLNWKLVIDTFLETYHLNVLHKNTIAPILHCNLGTFDGMGRNLRMIGARKTIDTLRRKPESEWDLVRHSALVYVLFPNTVFIMQGDHLETWRIYPGDSADESRMHVSLYTPEPAATSTQAASGTGHDSCFPGKEAGAVDRGQGFQFLIGKIVMHSVDFHVALTPLRISSVNQPIRSRCFWHACWIRCR